MDTPQTTPAQRLADLILAHEDNLAFTIMEIGAVPIDGAPEPFHVLLDLFPGTQVLAFEVDLALCDKLNQTSRPGMKFFPTALGRTEESRPFYQTRHPMCCSLYPPNEPLIGLYNNFEVAYLKSVDSIDTVSMDFFAAQHSIPSVDFIKIDIQGAELDVFEGGSQVLDQIVATVCEVEFIPQYLDQPLFGDVCSFLNKKDIMFHKFIGLAGRALSPIVVANNPNHATQHIWSDAVFIRSLPKLKEIAPQKLLKLGMLAYLFGSPDLTYHCFQHYDARNGTDMKNAFLAAVR